MSDYLKLDTQLDDRDIFDPIMETDSNFFINIQRLKKAETPEFQNSYFRINDLFRKIIKLLDKASEKNGADIFYKQALQLFDFSEVNGIGLGFAEEKTGSGFGKQLSKKVIDTAYDIVKAGITDPEFFELLPLFQDNVGPDRLSDMIATIILPDIRQYTERIMSELEIDPEHYPEYEFSEGYLINPYKKYQILLLPIEILHKLPVAESWEDIESVVSENETIRALMNHEVAEEWKKYSASTKKYYIRENIFKDTEAFKTVLDDYCKAELDQYDLGDRIDYFLEKLCQKILKLDIDWKSKLDLSKVGSLEAAKEILDYFKSWVEYNKGWEVIQDANSINREKIVQRVIHLAGMSYIKANNLSLSCEPDEGRGPVDFKVSRGQDITIIEVKLSSNSQYLHGYEVQIEEYAKAEQTDKMIYVLVNLSHPRKVSKIRKLHDDNIAASKRTPELVIVDSQKKISASRA
ncbi:MAG: hypothetical protein LUF78_02175 [Clostridiales bacterium]|nr:hypothetical protein [Clostridiales bacterium]